MELYILDGQLRRAIVIDRFESMIWTERFSAWGDFELHIFSTPEMRRLLPAGTRLSMSDSYRVMTVEVVENTTDSEGRAMLKVSGRSLEALMDERVARDTFADLATTPKWVLTGTPGNIARMIFDNILRTNANFPDDELPFLVAGSLFPPGTIEEPDAVITIELSLTTVYSAVQEICNAYDLGFRIVRNFDESELYFDIYSGNDRTTLQNVLAPVVFAPDLDNLTNISEITATANFRNVAYVFHPLSVQIITIDGVSVEVEGFDRRVLAVDASDIEAPALVYTLTTVQTDAINAAKALATDQNDINALDKLVSHNYLTAAEALIIQYYFTTSSLSSTHKTNLGAAYSLYDAQATAGKAILNTALQQRGSDELAKNRPIQAFDGELPSNSPYKYEIAYALGDLIEMRNSDGVTNQMRVTEQIFVSDAQGERSYPTLAIDRFITPGTWFAWDYNQTWENADGTWGDLGDEVPPDPDPDPPMGPSPVVANALTLMGSSGTKLTIPTHVSTVGGQTTHPSVVDFGTAWNGYRYWMAHTPYPSSNDAHEDPNIVVSNDGNTWIMPPGITNPLDDQAGSPGAYNSDVDLVHGPDGYLWCFWRTYDPTATGVEEKMYVRRSLNGVTWTPKVLIWQTDDSVMRLLSPSFVYEAGAWTMWAIDIVGTFTLRRARSSGPTLTSPSDWTAASACVLPSTGPGRQPWHVEIRKIEDVYIGMLNDRSTTNNIDGDLYMIKSADGITWSKGTFMAVPRSGGTSPGHQNLYRATFTKKDDNSLDCWYSAFNNSPLPWVWNIFRTTLE